MEQNLIINKLVLALANTFILVLILPMLGFVIDKIIRAIISIPKGYTTRKILLFLVNRVAFIGTVHHELAHMLVAIITGAKVINVNLFKPQGGSLGNVSIIPRGPSLLQKFQLAATAVAPMVLGALSEYLMYTKLLPLYLSGWQHWLLVYVIVSIGLHMTMSMADLKCYVKGIVPLSPILFIVVYITNFSIENFIG